MADFVYSSTDHYRTAGNRSNSVHGGYKSVQSWKSNKQTAIAPQAPNTQAVAQQQIVNNLEKAAKGQIGTFDMQLETGLAYSDAGQKIETGENQSEDTGYQFDDVVDVINPLHHLPVVGMIYRGLTGDTLHPVSQILGGAIFGGPIGAVTGTINAVSQTQTGKDVTDHVLGFAGLNFNGSKNTNFTPTIDKNNPELQLDSVAKNLGQHNQLEELPGSTLAFVNLAEPHKAYERVKIADGRTAGSMVVKKQMASYRQNPNTQTFNNKLNVEPPKTNLDNLPRKEEITTVQISSMPARQSI